jgi:hypothetical protein
MPRIDVFGWNLSIKKKPGDDGSNILTHYNRIPEWWSRPGQTEDQTKTRTKLHDQRRKERIPHISYDLDGDGYVGGKDYVVAKQFDKDGDGKLDAEERKAALEALKNVSETLVLKKGLGLRGQVCLERRGSRKQQTFQNIAKERCHL